VTTEQQHPDPSTRFKNRRRMAWGAFLTLVVFAFGLAVRLFIMGDEPEPWTVIANVVLGALVSIVLAYTGAAAYEHVKSSRNQ